MLGAVCSGSFTGSPGGHNTAINPTTNKKTTPNRSTFFQAHDAPGTDPSRALNIIFCVVRLCPDSTALRRQKIGLEHNQGPTVGGLKVYKYTLMVWRGLRNRDRMRMRMRMRKKRKKIEIKSQGSRDDHGSMENGQGQFSKGSERRSMTLKGSIWRESRVYSYMQDSAAKLVGNDLQVRVDSQYKRDDIDSMTISSPF